MANVVYVTMDGLAYTGGPEASISFSWFTLAVDQATGMTLPYPDGSGDYRSASPGQTQVSLVAGQLVTRAMIKAAVIADVRALYGDPTLTIDFPLGV